MTVHDVAYLAIQLLLAIGGIVFLLLIAIALMSYREAQR
jgi:hypothetical protein